MRPELQRLTDELTEVRVAVAAVEDTSRPAANGWTVAQVLAHLAKAHDLTVPRFDAALAAAPDAPGAPLPRPSLFERLLVRTMGGAIRMPVPPIFEPGAAGPEAKAACLASLDALLATVAKADGKRLTGLKVASPVNGRMRIGFLPYLDGLVQHARYHRRQI